MNESGLKALHSSEGGVISPFLNHLPSFCLPPFFQNCAIASDNDGMGEGGEVKFWTFEKEGEGATKIEQVWTRGGIQI